MARKLRYNDEEGGMVKAQLQKIETYAAKLNEMIHPEDEIESWVQAKLSVVAAYMGDIKHYLDYELQQLGEGGNVSFPKEYEVEFTWNKKSEEDWDARKVYVMAHTLDEAKEIVTNKFAPYYDGFRITEIEEQEVKKGYAKGGRTAKLYAVLYLHSEPVADVEVDSQDERVALKKFEEMGIYIPPESALRFQNRPPYYYNKGGYVNRKADGGVMAYGGGVDMNELELELKRYKKEYPNAKVSYSFLVNPNGKGYAIEVRENGKLIYTTYNDRGKVDSKADGGRIDKKELLSYFTKKWKKLGYGQFESKELAEEEIEESKFKKISSTKLEQIKPEGAGVMSKMIWKITPKGIELDSAYEKSTMFENAKWGKVEFDN